MSFHRSSSGCGWHGSEWPKRCAVSAGAGWSGYHAAHREQLDAERRLAELRGQEDAIEVDLGWAWDRGAPLPHLLASDRKVYLVCYLREPLPGWDGTWVQVVDPAAEGAMPLGGGRVERCAFGEARRSQR
jgi:hypothetical protein